MIVKLVGAAMVLACGAIYAKSSRVETERELSEAEYLLNIFKHLKHEIEEFDTPIYTVLKSYGIDGGVDGLLTEVKSERLKTAIRGVTSLGYGYKKEELRVCARLIDKLEEERKFLENKAKESKVMSRVKGIGIAAAVVILFI